MAEQPEQGATADADQGTAAPTGDREAEAEREARREAERSFDQLAEQEGQEGDGEQGEGAPDREQGEGDQAEGDQAAALRREAATYRRRLRESEAETSRVTAALDQTQRTLIEDQVAGQPGLLADAADFWRETKLEDLRADDGSVDPEKVKAALSRTLAEHPHWGIGGGGFDGGARRQSMGRAPSFGEALKEPRRG